jgi:hypothetical protein
MPSSFLPSGLSVTYVPKVPIWKALIFNGLRQACWERREIGGVGFSQLFETDAKPCAGMAVAACTPNLSTLPIGIRASAGSKPAIGKTGQMEDGVKTLEDIEAEIWQRAFR